MALGDNLRPKRCRRLPLHEAFRGKNASKRPCFYGVRVVVLLTAAGAPVEFAFLPGAAFDVRAYHQLPLGLPPGAQVYGDTADLSEELEALARAHEGVERHVCLRRDSVRHQRPEIKARQQIIRHPVQAAFRALLPHFGRHIHAVTFRGCQLKVLLFVLAHSLRKDCPP